jgi:topoisomerase-4 subunit B
MSRDTRRLVQLTLDADIAAALDGEAPTLDPAPTADMIMDMLLAKKRAGDRKNWLEEKGDKAEV